MLTRDIPLMPRGWITGCGGQLLLKLVYMLPSSTANTNLLNQLAHNLLLMARY